MRVNKNLVYMICFYDIKNYFITQTRGGLGFQTRIEQPTNVNTRRKFRAILAKPSSVQLCSLGK